MGQNIWVTVLTRVLFYKKMNGRYAGWPKKVAVITRRPYYRGGRKARFHFTRLSQATQSSYPTNFKIIHTHSATIIRCFMRIYSLPIKSLKCTLNFSFKLIFSGFFVFQICFLVLLTRPLRRVYINGLFRNNGLSLLYERRERE